MHIYIHTSANVGLCSVVVVCYKAGGHPGLSGSILELILATREGIMNK